MNATKTTAAPVENAPVLYTPENIMAIMQSAAAAFTSCSAPRDFPLSKWAVSSASKSRHLKSG